MNEKKKKLDVSNQTEMFYLSSLLIQGEKMH